MTDLATLTDKIRTAVGADSGLGKTLKLDLKGDGVIFLDATQTPNVVSNDDAPADTTVSVSLADFKGIVSGAIDPTMAFMTGKLKVAGDMGAVMKLQPILAKARG